MGTKPSETGELSLRFMSGPVESVSSHTYMNSPRIYPTTSSLERWIRTVFVNDKNGERQENGGFVRAQSTIRSWGRSMVLGNAHWLV